MTNPSDDTTPLWQGMDVETRNVAYSPSSALDGPIDPYIQAYIDQSAAAYAAHPETRSIRYGQEPANTVDFVAPVSADPVPLHVFIHGGYWQELSKKESFFPATDTLARGMAFAAVDYTLAPVASLDQIVAECVAALGHLAKEATGLGVDPSRIVVSGSSAGAHLAAMCCLKLPPHLRPRGVVLLSGVFDLTPLLGTYINDAVGMDAEAARRNSPALADLTGFPKAVIAWGRQETDEFKSQSRHFASLLRAAGSEAETLELPSRNHFDIVHDLANSSDLGQMLAALADVTGDA